MQEYKAIMVDIDGTLTPIIPNSLPTKRVSETIKKIIDKGVIFCLVSGRPLYLVEYLANHLNLSSPLIVDNGAAIVDRQGLILWEALLTSKTANKIIKLTKNQPLFRVSTDLGVLENPKTVPQTARVRKISIHDMEINDAEKFIERVGREFKEVVIVKASSYKGDKYLDLYISNAKATKQYAILKYSEILKIATTEMIGVGDGYNDFPLLMACGLKVAMGNAVDELKAIADFVAPTVDDDGLALVIEKYML